ncbi:AimR family lysis-lysogeny pheromone receptor [Bacillus sp. Marseille-P3800]|uniref:AimR family lysis-lysogeny pheromone receptor n=1 Tax=Bacillus sp. Marseille-P3800 TaxID=2014782 RepID=UPI000C07CB1D|nr:AimR family lysis-lysogeny pheromone receptor [Bacillus sp. Marseille-P3800]
MKYVYEEVAKWMNENNKKQIDLSNGASVSKAIISRLLKTEGEKNLEFSSVLSIFRYIEPEHYMEKMDEYCARLTKPQGILNALEYAYNFQRIELTNDLLAEHSDRKGDIRHWLKVYALQRDIDKKSEEIAFEEMRELYGQVEQTEVKIRLDLIEHNLSFRNNNYSTSSFLERINKKIELLQEGFLKETYRLRYFFIQSLCKLYEQDSPDTAIQYAKYILLSPATPDLLKAPVEHMLGHAYMISDLEKSVYYIKKAATTYRSVEDPRYMGLESDDINFVQNINNALIPLDGLSGEELAHQYIVRNEMANALTVLNNFDEDSKTSYYYIYFGIAEKNLLKFLKGYGILMKTGNVFLSQIFESKFYAVFENREVLV